MPARTYDPDEWELGPKTLAERNNNPGNLRYAKQKGAMQGESDFARFETPEEGFTALENQVNLDASRGHTLKSFISKYAPPSENDTVNYLSFMEKEVGANADDPLSSLDTKKVSGAIAKFEGGTVPPKKKKSRRGTYNPDEWDWEGVQQKAPVMAEQSEDKIDEAPGLIGGAINVAKGIGSVFTDTIPKTVAQTIRGGDKNLKKSWLDDYISTQEQEEQEATKYTDKVRKETYIDLPLNLGKITYGDLDDLKENIGYSVTNMLASGAGAKGGAAIGGALTGGNPLGVAGGGLAGGFLAGTAVSGRATKDQFIETVQKDFLEENKDLPIEEQQERWDAIYDELNTDANWQGFFEAAPETFGNMLTFGIFKFGGKLTKPLFKKVQNEIAKKIGGGALKGLAILAEEEGTETATQYLSAPREVKYGIRDKPLTVSEAAKEVLPQVLLLTPILGGAGKLASKISEKQQPSQPEDKKAFADQLNVLSDELKESKNKPADISTAIGLHSQLAEDPEKQAALDQVILDAVETGLNDGTITPEMLPELSQQLPENDPLRDVLVAPVEEPAVPVEEPQPVIEPEPVSIPGAEAVLKRMQQDKSLPETEQLTATERRQKRIDAAGEIERPSEVIKERFPDGQTVTIQEIEELLKKKKATEKQDRARIEELSKGTLQMPVDIDLESTQPQDKYKIDKAFDFIDKATEKLGGKLTINIVDKNGQPISPANVREVPLKSDKQRAIEEIEKEITDRWKQAKKLPPGKKKSQIVNEVTALNAEMERAMLRSKSEPRGKRVAPERGKVEKEKLETAPTSTPYKVPENLKDKIVYNGIQEGFGRVPETYTFTDNKTGSTFLIPTTETDIPSEIESRLATLDKDFGRKEALKKQEITEPIKPKTHAYIFRGKTQTVGKDAVGKAFIKDKQRPILSQRLITRGKNKGKFQVLYPSGKTNDAGAKIARSAIIDADAITAAVGGKQDTTEPDIAPVKKETKRTPKKIKLSESHIFEYGLKDGAMKYNLEDKSPIIYPDNLTLKREYAAFQAGHDLGMTGAYQKEYKAGKHLGVAAVKTGDIIPDGWEYTKGTRGQAVATEIKKSEEPNIEITGKKDKTVEVDLTAKEEKSLTPKEQKKYLLAEIDAAIEEARGFEYGDAIIKRNPIDATGSINEQEQNAAIEEYEEYKDKYGEVTINVPNDGTFTILNVKSVLQEFKKKAKSFPGVVLKNKPATTRRAANRSFKQIKRVTGFAGEYRHDYKPFYHKVVETIEDSLPMMPRQWYDGNFFFIPEYGIRLKEKPNLKKVIGTDKKEIPNYQRVVNKNKDNLTDITSAKSLYLNPDGSKEIKPILEVEHKAGKALFNIYQADAIMSVYPNAKMAIGKANDLLLFKDKNKIVGFIMPYAPEMLPWYFGADSSSTKTERTKYAKEIKDESSEVSEPTGGDISPQKTTGKPKWPKVVSNRRRRYLSQTTHIKNSGDAAAFASYNLSDFPQERFVALLLGDEGKILGAHRFSVGTHSSAQADLGMLAGQALNTKGVKEVVLVHNHPSGNAKLSEPDVAVANAFSNLLTDTKINAGEIIAVGADEYSTNNMFGIHKIPKLGKAGIRVPMLVRRFKSHGENLPVVSGPKDAKNIGSKILKRGGLMFLNNRNSVVGTMRIDNYSKMRGEYATKILKQLEKTNATAVIAYNPTKDLQKIGINNLKRFTNASQLTLMDAIGKTGALRDVGLLPESSSSVYYETSKSKDRPLTNEDIYKAFARMKNVTTGQDKMGNLWFRFKGFPKFTILEIDSVNNRLGLTDRRPRTGAFLPKTKQIWFKTGGSGVNADIGTLYHENYHLFKKMGVVSKADTRAIKRAIKRSGNLQVVTEEMEASFIGDAAKKRAYARDTVIGRILQKIGDFFDAMVNLVTTTSKGVVRKVESGKMAVQNKTLTQTDFTPAMAFETMAKEFGVSEEQLRKEFEETKAKYEGTDKWLKAPNGKDSNLGEHAWVMTHTPRFKKWFDGSKVVDENGEPLTLYHGGSSAEGVFKSAKELFFFTTDKQVAESYTPSKVTSTYLSLKNPFDPTKREHIYSKWVQDWIDLWRKEHGWEDRRSGYEMSDGEVHFMIKKTALYDYESDNSEERWYNFLQTAKEHHDGFYGYAPTEGATMYIAFNPTQIKSIYNTGAFSKTDPDIRYETKDVDLSEEIAEEDSTFQQAIDLISAHWGKQGKYTNERKKLTFLEHHFGTTMYNAKRIGGWYNRFYNVIRNLGQYKFEQQNRLRGEGDASLFAPLETFSKKNKTEYRKLKKYLVNYDIDAESYKVRPTLDETSDLYEGAYDLINEKGTVVDTLTSEEEAFNEMWEIEADATDFTDAGKEALLNFRKMTRNLYKHYAAGMQDIIEMARLSGQPEPKVTTVIDGKPVKISLKTAIQEMGDRQGYYFPRIRESGEWKIEGTKPDMPTQLKFFASKALSKGYAQKLRREGYKVESVHSGAFSEDLYQTLAPLLAQEQVVNSVIDKVSKNEDFDAVYADMFIKQYANMLKSHGSRARMIGRSDAVGINVKRGYETDPVKAIAIATEAAAGGYAKQQIAINAMKAITGRDLTWLQYKQDNPGKKHEDYLKEVRKRGADAARQQVEYKEATTTLQDILKNQELADRVVGTLKGMAVVWYLGGRVSSAAVNITNMVMGVPATMVGELSDKASKISFTQAFKHIGRAGIAYGNFRRGKSKNAGEADLFQEIENRGWDAPQFNMEALNALQNKYGKAWHKVIDASMWMFGVTEKINRATTIGANYMALCKKNKVKLLDSSGELHEKFLLKARNASDVAHGVYEKGNRPYHMRGDHVGARVLQMAYVFQTFTHNYLQEMVRLGLVKKQYGAAAYMALSGGMLGGLGATVPIVVAKAIAALFDADDPEEEMIKWADDAFGGGQFFRYGLPGLLGISFKGSLATRLDIPQTTLEWFGAPGNVVADIWSGTKNLTKGFYREGFEQVAPVSIGNISRGLRESNEGVTTKSGSPVFFGKERLKGDSYDMMLRWLSFNPTGLSEKREIQWNEYKVIDRYKRRRSELYKRLKRFYFKPPGKRNTKDKVDILADIRDFNIEIRRKKIARIVRPITKRSIKQSLRSLKPSKRERER